MRINAFLTGAALALGLGNTVQAQFNSAAEVKPILEMTQGNWLGVRVYDGNDLLYFTHLVTFRCGLEEVLYGLNGETPSQPLPMQPCDENAPNPAAMDPVNFPPYMTFPVGSIHSVSLIIMYDDGDIQDVTFERAQIQMQ